MNDGGYLPFGEARKDFRCEQTHMDLQRDRACWPQILGNNQSCINSDLEECGRIAKNQLFVDVNAIQPWMVPSDNTPRNLSNTKQPDEPKKKSLDRNDERNVSKAFTGVFTIIL